MCFICLLCCDVMVLLHRGAFMQVFRRGVGLSVGASKKKMFHLAVKLRDLVFSACVLCVFITDSTTNLPKTQIKLIKPSKNRKNKQYQDTKQRDKHGPATGQNISKASGTPKKD